MIYLTYNTNLVKILSLLAFIPQILLIVIFSILFSSNLHFCIVLITIVFVHFNKVITAQYFLWYFSLLPLIFHQNQLFKKMKGILILSGWIICELTWNYGAHMLEYKGENMFMFMFVIEVLFFSFSVIGIKELIKEQEI